MKRHATLIPEDLTPTPTALLLTGFALPEGTASLSITPECPDPNHPGGNLPADLRTYVAPAPVIRQVKRGDTITLGAVELVIKVSNPCGLTADQPCICNEDKPR